YRIELGEIESCLSALEGVNQSVVLVKEHGDSKHLVAYIDGLTSLDKTLLEESLKTVLPEYMIPRIYVIVDGFKLTSSGKIDKKILPDPGFEDYSVTEYVAPETELEQELAAIWMELLGLERVGVKDDFFALGGNSLLISRLLYNIISKLEINITMMDFFQDPTIKGICKHKPILKDEAKLNVDGIVRLKRVNEDSPKLFFLHDGSGDVYGYKHLIDVIDDYNCYGITYKSNHLHPVIISVEELAIDYISKIKEIQPNGPYNFIGWSLGGLLATEIVSQLEKQREKIDKLIIVDSYFNLGEREEEINFDLKSELDVINSLSNLDFILENNMHDVKSLWEITIQKIKTNNKISEDILKKLPKQLRRLIPISKKQKNMNIEELFIEVNKIRSLKRTNMKYTLNQKINTETIYYKAEENDSVSLDDLKKYFSSITFNKTTYNHFTVMEKPFVEKIKNHVNL
ncbi:MAG: hypothetical protein JXR05_16560, partial [Flavobacteriaceae bacterium]